MNPFDPEQRREAWVWGRRLAAALALGLLIAKLFPELWGLVVCLGMLGALACMALPIWLIGQHRRDLHDDPNPWWKIRTGGK